MHCFHCHSGMMVSLSFSCTHYCIKFSCCYGTVFVFRDCAWARFSLRGKKVKLQQSWFPRKKQLKNRMKKIHYYTAIVARHVDPLKTTTAGHKLLKPAWNQARISSPTQVMVSSTVRTRRSKVLLFLSFQSSQQIKTTIESKHCLSSFAIFFLESHHQVTRRVCLSEVCTCSVVILSIGFLIK